VGELPKRCNYFAGDTLFTPVERRRGIPIGNLTSQFFANVFLNPLDHLVKETLQCRFYIRYCDDFVIFDNDKRRLNECLENLTEGLTPLRLKLQERKCRVYRVEEGVDFLGYRVWPSHRRLRRSNGIRFQRRLRTMQEDYRGGKVDLPELRQRLASWNGHASHADTHRLRSALLDGAVFSRA